jgi:hypothetical protein
MPVGNRTHHVPSQPIKSGGHVPTGKSFRICGKWCQVPNKKTFRFFRTANETISTPIPSRQEGRSRSFTNVGRGAVDAGSADNERRESVRRSRVVPMPRSWRRRWQQCKAHRGERVISRKATAQGMSDVLRCPVCSCAHLLPVLRMRPRVQRASGIPRALRFSRGSRKINCKPRAQCVARSRLHIQLSSPGFDRATQYSREASDSIEKPRRTGFPHARE